MHDLAAALALLLLPAAAGAQTLAQRAETLGTARLRLSFAARAGRLRQRRAQHHDRQTTTRTTSGRATARPGPCGCRSGCAAAGWRRPHLRRRPLASAATGKTTDLGQLPARQAAADLLALVEQQPGGRGGAGHRRHAGRQRGRVAGAAPDRPAHRAAARDAAAGDLLAGPGGRRGGDARARLARVRRRRGELEVRKQAVFALSQRPADEGVPALIRIARSNPHAELRKTGALLAGPERGPAGDRVVRGDPALGDVILSRTQRSPISDSPHAPITFPHATPTPSSARCCCLPRAARSGRRRRS